MFVLQVKLRAEGVEPHLYKRRSGVVQPWGHTFCGPTGFDADGIPGWNAADARDDHADNAWDLRWDFAMGRIYNKG